MSRNLKNIFSTYWSCILLNRGLELC